jgi:hypothetical protein
VYLEDRNAIDNVPMVTINEQSASEGNTPNYLVTLTETTVKTIELLNASGKWLLAEEVKNAIVRLVKAVKR